MEGRLQQDQGRLQQGQGHLQQGRHQQGASCARTSPADFHAGLLRVSVPELFSSQQRLITSPVSDQSGSKQLHSSVASGPVFIDIASGLQHIRNASNASIQLKYNIHHASASSSPELFRTDLDTAQPTRSKNIIPALLQPPHRLQRWLRLQIPHRHQFPLRLLSLIRI